MMMMMIMKFQVLVLCRKVVPPYSGRFWTPQSPCRRPFANECSVVNLPVISCNFTS